MAKNLKKIFNLNDQIIELLGLVDNTDPSNPAVVTTATVTATMVDQNGGAISQITSLSLAHVSNGDYRGFVEDTINLPVGVGYILTIDGDDSGVKFHFRFEVEVTERLK